MDPTRGRAGGANLSGPGSAPNIAQRCCSLPLGPQPDDEALKLLPHLVVSLKKWSHGVDMADIQTAAHDAVLRYLNDPSRYEAHLGSLFGWLRSVALNRLRDMRRCDRRRARREVLAGVDFFASCPAEPDGSWSLNSGRHLTARSVLQVAKNRREWDFLTARLDGQRRVVELARILGLGSVSDSEKRRVVHRTWARLRARILAQAKRLSLTRPAK